MSKFRKKPVVIEAEQFNRNCVEWPNGVEWDSERGEPVIHTLEGDHIVSDGDWVITGIKGERYPCKPDIFEMTYEPAQGERSHRW